MRKIHIDAKVHEFKYSVIEVHKHSGFSEIKKDGLDIYSKGIHLIRTGSEKLSLGIYEINEPASITEYCYITESENPLENLFTSAKNLLPTTAY